MYFDETTREVFLYQDIGPAWAGGIDSEMMLYALKKLGNGNINLRVNSYGGSVDEALAMVAILERHQGDVNVTVDSIAASAASFFPVKFKSSAASSSRIMIHDPLSIVWGNSRELRKIADVLDLHRDSIVEIYKAGMKKSDDEIKALMAAETWFSAKEAFENGLIGEVVEPSKHVAAGKVPHNRGFINVPQDLLNQNENQSTQIDNRIAASLALLKRKLKK